MTLETTLLPLAAFAATTLAQGLVVFLLATTIVWTLRRRSAGLQHRIWCLAFVASLGAPALPALLPARFLPALELRARLPAPTVPTGAPGTPGSGLIGQLFGAARKSGPAAAPPAAAATPVPPPADARREERPGVGSAAEPGTDRASPAGAATTWPAAFAALWLAGVLATGGELARRRAGVRRSLGSFSPAGPAILGAARSASTHLGLRRLPPIVVGSTAPVAVVWGTLRPVVVLPRSARAWSPDALDVVLRHELTHVRRGDPWSILAVQLACALHWLNPLAWRAAARMELERERACDDAVIRSGVRPSGYAGHLLDLSRSLPRPSATPLAMATASNLRRRIERVLDPGQARTPPGRSTRSLTLLAAALVSLLLAQPGTEAQREAPRATEPTLPADDVLRRRAVHRLGDRADADTYDLVSRLATGDPDPAVRREASWARREIIQRFSLRRLEATLADPDPGARENALHFLGDRRRDRSVPAVLPLLEDPSVAVRRKAAWTLGEIGNADAGAALLRVANDRGEALDVRTTAVRGVGEIRDPRTLPSLVALLRDERWQLRAQAADALGNLRSRDAIEPLEIAFDDPHREVRASARKALKRTRRAAWIPGL